MHHSIIVGITGSIGTGKSTVANLFNNFSIPVWNADQSVHKNMAVGTQMYKEILELFKNQDILNSDSIIDRGKIGKIVFDDKDKLDQLEVIIYQYTDADRYQFYKDNFLRPVVVLDVPLLFEKGLHAECDFVITTTVSSKTQIERTLKRDQNMDIEKLQKIMQNQMPNHKKIRYSDYVINTGRPIRYIRQEISYLLNLIT